VAHGLPKQRWQSIGHFEHTVAVRQTPWDFDRPKRDDRAIVVGVWETREHMAKQRLKERRKATPKFQGGRNRSYGTGDEPCERDVPLELENKHQVLAPFPARWRKNFIRILEGDKVAVAI